MEIDEQPGHRVEQAFAVRPRSERESEEEPPELERVAQVLRDDDGGLAGRPNQANRRDRGKPHAFQVVQDLVLTLAGVRGLLLEREQRAIDDQEADEMPGRPDRKIPESEIGRPLREPQLPRQVEQRAGPAQPDAASTAPGRVVM